MRRVPLRVLFAQLNRTHFDGQLPAYRVRRAVFPWMDTVRQEVRRLRRQRPRPARPGSDREGDCNYALRLIRISDVLSPEGERRVLLHEMCHLATPGDEHGAAWRAVMQSLADKGEGWAVAEAARYDGDEAGGGSGHIPGHIGPVTLDGCPVSL